MKYSFYKFPQTFLLQQHQAVFLLIQFLKHKIAAYRAYLLPPVEKAQRQSSPVLSDL